MKEKTGRDSAAAPAPDREVAEYHAPAVERVMNADDLAREIHYAGTENTSADPG